MLMELCFFKTLMNTVDFGKVLKIVHSRHAIGVGNGNGVFVREQLYSLYHLLLY